MTVVPGTNTYPFLQLKALASPTSLQVSIPLSAVQGVHTFKLLKKYPDEHLIGVNDPSQALADPAKVASPQALTNYVSLTT